MFDRLSQGLADYAPNLLFALVIFIAGYLVIRFILFLVKKFLKKSHIDATAGSFLVSLLRAILYVILGVMILSQLQVPMSSIVAALGTAGLAIGLALRDSLTNVAGGFILMFNRPFKAGDFIEINGKEGVVKHITILYTKLLTIDNKAILIPNGTVASATITNFTQEELRRLELVFDISYSSNYRAAEALILEKVNSNPLTLQAPDKPFITLSEHSESSVKILLRVWVRSENYWDLRFALLSDIKDAFDQNGIKIPFNQLDVHVN
ncbi:MAG: mechanosensitive ion channel family protein [Oscillospiraceae bacterium]